MVGRSHCVWLQLNNLQGMKQFRGIGLMIVVISSSRIIVDSSRVVVADVKNKQDFAM